MDFKWIGSEQKWIGSRKLGFLPNLSSSKLIYDSRVVW